LIIAHLREWKPFFGDCSRPLAEVFDFAALALGVSTVSAFSFKQAIANSRKTEQHSLQAAPQTGRE